jgi:hypothetical protein
MTIELTPEQEQVIDRAIQASVIRTADDVVAVGVEAIRRRFIEQPHAHAEDAIKQVEIDSIQRPLEERCAPMNSTSAEQWLQEFHAWVHTTRQLPLCFLMKPSIVSRSTAHAARKWRF